MKFKGSATIEAAFILPAVLVFFGSFIWMIDIFRIHSGIGAVINDVGRTMSAYSYAYDTILKGCDNAELITMIASVGWSESFLRNSIENTPEAKNISNLSLLNCSIDKDGAISFRVSYSVKPYIEVPGLKGVVLTNSYFCKCYVGCATKEVLQEEYVFITKNSDVYHTDEKCRGLTRNVISVLYTEIGEKRNQARGKYYACSKCGNISPGNVVFVTPQGDRYHSNENCSELVVTVYKIPLDEIGERRKCYYCR